MSSVTAPQALEELSNKSKRLKDNIAVTRELIGQKKKQGEKNLLVQSIKGASFNICFVLWLYIYIYILLNFFLKSFSKKGINFFLIVSVLFFFFF